MMVTRRAMARAVALIHLLVARTGCGSARAEGGAPTASVGGGNGTTAVAWRNGREIAAQGRSDEGSLEQGSESHISISRPEIFSTTTPWNS